MPETVVWCASGCTVRGQHTADCPAGPEVECRGCQPRQATVGRLCGWCYQRLRLDVAAAPDIVEHLRLVAEPDAGAAPPSDTRSYSDPSEGSVLSAAVDAADEIHAVLASWAQYVIETFPSPIKGPSQAGWWRTETTTRVDPETGEAYARGGWTQGARTPAATAELATWFDRYLDWCAEQSWAGDMRAEVGSLIGTTRARWPIAERSRPVPYATCPECDRASLVYHPPAYFKAQAQVTCSHKECAEVLDERKWGMVVRLIEHERAIDQAAKAKEVAAK